MSSKNKSSNQKPVSQYIDLLYMTPLEVSAKDIALVLQENSTYTVELWEEMNVLELELANQNSVDFEPLSTSFSNPSDAAFIKNRNIKTVFAINLCETDLNTVLPSFEKIIEKHSGFLCADTEDFMPVYAGSSKRV